jgi:hypothetical protein
MTNDSRIVFIAEDGGGPGVRLRKAETKGR